MSVGFRKMEKRPLIVGTLVGLVFVALLYRHWAMESGFLTMFDAAGKTLLARDHAAWVQLLWGVPGGLVAGVLGATRATEGFKYGFVTGLLTLSIGITSAFLGRLWFFITQLGNSVVDGGIALHFALGLLLLVTGVALALGAFIIVLLSLIYGLCGSVGAGAKQVLPS